MTPNTHLSDVAQVVRNEATAAQLRGGRLELCDGEPPSNANEATGERPVLVRMVLPSSKLSVRAERGGIVLRGIDIAQVVRQGQPRWWRAYSKDDAPVAFGRVSAGEAAAAAFAKAEKGSFPGVAVEAAMLWPGMDIEIGELRLAIGGVL